MNSKDNITNLFGKSPINPLQKHMKQVHSCLKEFGVFAKAANSEDWEKAQLAHISIGKKEQKADVLKKKLRMNLPSTFMMPFSRRDLLDVLLIQDSIANITKDLAGLMMSRKMVLTVTGWLADAATVPYYSQKVRKRPTACGQPEN